MKQADFIQNSEEKSAKIQKKDPKNEEKFAIVERPKKMHFPFARLPAEIIMHVSRQASKFKIPKLPGTFSEPL